MTKSAPEEASSRSVVKVILLKAASTSSCSIRLFSTLRLMRLSSCSWAFFSMSSSTSWRVTAEPARAQTIPIWDPIAPEPTTSILFIWSMLGSTFSLPSLKIRFALLQEGQRTLPFIFPGEQDRLREALDEQHGPLIGLVTYLCPTVVSAYALCFPSSRGQLLTTSPVSGFRTS